MTGPRREEVVPSSAPRNQWLPGSGEGTPHDRSLLLEVIARLLFPSMLVLSLYLLFSGHYRPGGGFAGGLVVGQAFMLRFLAGGAPDLEAAVFVPPGVLAGAGLVLASAVGLAPLAVGGAPLSSARFALDVGGVAHVEVVTSLFFDVGVYLLVVGALLKLLSAFGSSLEPDGGS